MLLVKFLIIEVLMDMTLFWKATLCIPVDCSIASEETAVSYFRILSNISGYIASYSRRQ
jgi:hypothetical protein